MIDNEIPLILVSGLGADSRVFKPQLAAFKNVITIPWIKPTSSESLEEYANRLAVSICPSSIAPSAPCYVAGLSLGGILAPMIAKHLNTKACLLIGTIRKPSEFPKRHLLYYRICRHFPEITAWWFWGVQWELRCFMPIIRRVSSPHRVSIIEQFIDTPARQYGHFLRMLFTWAYDPKTWLTNNTLDIRSRYDFPIYHIHGKYDRILPCRNTDPDKIIPGGHVITLSRSDEVNRFITDVMQGNAANIS